MHRVQFNQVLSSNTSLTVSRYLRLILLCSVEMALVTPLGAFSIYINTAGLHVAPWVSWANTHFNFSFVELFPTAVWQAKLASHVAIEMGRWIYPCSAIMFFMLFGFAEEARRCYVDAFWKVAKFLNISPKSKSGSDKTKGYVHLSCIDTGADLPACSFKRAFQLNSNAAAGEVPPPYTPPAHIRKNRRDSLTSSLAATLEDFDLEKGSVPQRPRSTHIFANLPSPSDSEFGSMQLSPLPTATASEFSHPRISISDEHPASRPPTPPPTVVQVSQPEPALGVPAFHRPFSPPVMWPGALSVARKPSVGSISIMVHTESRTF